MRKKGGTTGVPDYSMRQLRREYAGTLRLLRVLLLSSFGAAVLLCWVVYIGKAAHTPADVRTFSLIPLAAFFVLLGLYLVLSGPGRMLRRTPYGRFLTALGDPRQLMRQIDEEARDAEDYPNVALLKSWLILYFLDRPQKGPGRVCAHPVPVESICAIELWHEKGGVWMRVLEKDGEAGRVFISGKEECRAVTQWLKAQEIKAQWIK